jgi:putative Ca2+/H+ antiporter (TMEM165/GDT1 family)
MDLKTFAVVSGTVFVAELADKTQLATLLFAAEHRGAKLTVFLAASAGLVAAAGLGVLAGAAVAQWINPRQLSFVAGLGFIAIGAWTLWRAW